MTQYEIERYFTNCEPWYHIIELAEGIRTPGREELIPQWQMMRNVRRAINYAGKRVLDLATYDGMWAFEAEELGASFVVGADCIHLGTFQNFLFARACRKSRALPFFNIPSFDVFNRLDIVFDDIQTRFDIVHHMGLLYHLRDPMASLAEARSCLNDGGILLLETAVTKENGQVGAMFNGPQKRIYNDHTTCWVPSPDCLNEMLYMSGFNIVQGSAQFIGQENWTNRVCLIAEARPINPDAQDDREFSRRSRNIGLHLQKTWLPRPA
jgi:SAM-dependent methyltransferase